MTTILCPGCRERPMRIIGARGWDYCDVCSPPPPTGRDDGDLLTRKERARSDRLRRLIDRIDPDPWEQLHRICREEREALAAEQAAAAKTAAADAPNLFDSEAG